VGYVVAGARDEARKTDEIYIERQGENKNGTNRKDQPFVENSRECAVVKNLLSPRKRVLQSKGGSQDDLRTGVMILNLLRAQREKSMIYKQWRVRSIDASRGPVAL
jgi:hypothetical protein